MERPAKLGNKAFLTVEEARALAQEEQEAQAKGLAQSDGDREAPPPGGAKVVGLEDTETGGNEFGAGNVGGYNLFWIDRGTEAFTVDGKIPTSIIVDPPNGRMPAMTPAAAKDMMARFSGFLRANDGTAWWLKENGPGPYDGPESLAMSERCMLGFTGAAPTLPSLYNNFKRIVQTEDHVMILIEMVHDARIVRMNSKHPGPEVRKWLGDSIGSWDGDTLVVDTTNFHPESSMRGGSENLHVVERFTMKPTATSCTASRSRTRRCGPRPGPASTSGTRPTIASTSTPATKATTPWATCSAGRGCWRRKLSPGSDSSPPRPREGAARRARTTRLACPRTGSTPTTRTRFTPR